jgi:hypothetical protein
MLLTIKLTDLRREMGLEPIFYSHNIMFYHLNYLILLAGVEPTLLHRNIIFYHLNYRSLPSIGIEPITYNFEGCYSTN